MFYYRGLKEWDNEKGYLTDTCLTAQDKYKAYLDYFRITYLRMFKPKRGKSTISYIEERLLIFMAAASGEYYQQPFQV